jgi:hypothetical protein
MTQLPSAATHSSLDLFQKTPVLINFDHGTWVETFPVSGVDGPTLEFELQNDRNVFLDLSEIYLQLVIGVKDLSTKKYVAKDVDLYLTNNILHSLFSDCTVTLNGEHISSSNNLYAHKTFISTEWSHTEGCKDSLLACQGYEYCNDPDDEESIAENKRDLSKANKFYGKLAVDFFNCDKLLVPNSKIRIKLLKHNSNFVLHLPVTEDTKLDATTGTDKTAKNYVHHILKASIFSRHMIVAENVYTSIERALLKSPARYTYTDTEAKTFIVPAGQSTCVHENVFNNKPIRSIAIAMNNNEDFIGSIESDPFSFKPFGLQRIVLKRNGLTLYDVTMSEGGHVRMFYTTLKSLHFDHDGPGISLDEFIKNHFVMVFDLTSTMQSNTQVYYPELIGGAIRLEMTFKEALKKSVEVLLIGEQLTTLYVKASGEVYKDGQ